VAVGAGGRDSGEERRTVRAAGEMPGDRTHRHVFRPAFGGPDFAAGVSIGDPAGGRGACRKVRSKTHQSPVPPGATTSPADAPSAVWSNEGAETSVLPIRIEMKAQY